jgi:glutamate synthase (NADPH/NADH) small chain
MSQNVYQFIDLQRVDPPKKPLKIRKIEFVEIYEPFQKARPKRRQTAACPAVTRIANGSARCTTSFPNWLKLVAEGHPRRRRTVSPDKHPAGSLRQGVSPGSSV